MTPNKIKQGTVMWGSVKITVRFGVGFCDGGGEATRKRPNAKKGDYDETPSVLRLFLLGGKGEGVG